MFFYVKNYGDNLIYKTFIKKNVFFFKEEKVRGVKKTYITKFNNYMKDKRICYKPINVQGYGLNNKQIQLIFPIINFVSERIDKEDW